MPSLEDAYAGRVGADFRLALALALVLAGSGVAALGVAAVASPALAALVVPATLAGLHAVVPAARRLRLAAAAGVGLCVLGVALHWTVGGAAATVAYGVGVLAALWSLVAAGAAAVERDAPAPEFAVTESDRPLYDGRSRAGEHVMPADGGTEDDDLTPLLDDEN